MNEKDNTSKIRIDPFPAELKKRYILLGHQQNTLLGGDIVEWLTYLMSNPLVDSSRTDRCITFHVPQSNERGTKNITFLYHN